MNTTNDSEMRAELERRVAHERAQHKRVSEALIRQRRWRIAGKVFFRALWSSLCWTCCFFVLRLLDLGSRAYALDAYQRFRHTASYSWSNWIAFLESSSCGIISTVCQWGVWLLAFAQALHLIEYTFTCVAEEPRAPAYAWNEATVRRKIAERLLLNEYYKTLPSAQRPS